MRETYDQVFPGGLGIFQGQKQRLLDCPLHGVDSELKKAISEKFITLEGAAQKTGFSKRTMGKRFADIKYMVMNDSPWAKKYFRIEDVKTIIKEKKKCRKK